jgi:hypothetical protein
VPVQPLPGWGGENGLLAAFADGKVDRPGGARGERDARFLRGLAGDGQAMAAFGAECFDVGAGGLGYPQRVEGAQGDQRVLAAVPSPAATSSAPASLRSRAAAWDS